FTNLCMDDILKFRGHFTTLSISFLWNLNRTNVTDISIPLITCSALQQCRVLQVPRLSCTQDIWDSHIVMLSSLQKIQCSKVTFLSTNTKNKFLLSSPSLTDIKLRILNVSHLWKLSKTFDLIQDLGLSIGFTQDI